MVSFSYAGFHTVKESAGDFSTLEAAMEDAGLANGDTIEISGAWTAAENTAIATNHSSLYVYATGAALHSGREWTTGETGFRHRYTSNGTGDSFTLTEAGGAHKFEGLDIQRVSASGAVSAEVFDVDAAAGATGYTWINCILGFNAVRDQQDIVYDSTPVGAKTFYFENCIFYSVDRGVLDIYADAGAGLKVEFNSCTAYDVNYDGLEDRAGLFGISANTNTMTVNVFNTIAGIAAGINACVICFTSADDNDVSMNLDRNITNVGDLSVVRGPAEDTDTDNIVEATFSVATDATVQMLDITIGPFDLHLTDDATNNIAQEAHSDGTGVSQTMPTTDIDGDTRATVYDIGADFIVPAGAPDQPSTRRRIVMR